MTGLGRKLAVGGLALLAIPTALWIGLAISLHHHRWLWDPPPYPLRGVNRDVVIEVSWQAPLLLLAWLAGWWLIYVRKAKLPLRRNRPALIALAIFVVFTGLVTVWSLSATATLPF